MKRKLCLLFGIAAVVGNIQTAGAQCVVDKKTVFIDPRLVPRRPQVSRQSFELLIDNPNASAAEKLKLRDEYMSQFQPIVIPYAGGRVIVAPTDPCIQQFIPRSNR